MDTFHQKVKATFGDKGLTLTQKVALIKQAMAEAVRESVADAPEHIKQAMEKVIKDKLS